MNEAERILFDLRNELAQAVEAEGRAALQDQLKLVQWMISERVRGDCPHIHAEHWQEIRALLAKSATRTGWPSKRYCSYAGDGHE
jgi:hypothetical protein